MFISLIVTHSPLMQWRCRRCRKRPCFAAGRQFLTASAVVPVSSHSMPAPLLLWHLYGVLPTATDPLGGHRIQ